MALDGPIGLQTGTRASEGKPGPFPTILASTAS